MCYIAILSPIKQLEKSKKSKDGKGEGGLFSIFPINCDIYLKVGYDFDRDHGIAMVYFHSH